MRVRSVLLACVYAVCLAAPAAVSGVAVANESSSLNLSAAARTALQAGDTQTAIAGFSEAIEARDLPPEMLANALINRGFAHQQGGEHERAIDDYTAALRVDAMGAKLRATALYNRGLSYQKLRQPALAIEDFTSALFLDPEFAHAYYLRATILRESGQYLFALSDYEKAIRFKHPQAYLAYYGQGLTFDALDRPRDAQASLSQALKANPSFEPARTKLAALGALPAVADAAVRPDNVMITASITGAAHEQIVRKETLPDAVKPPAELIGNTSSGLIVKAAVKKPAKLYTDRVPQEQSQIAQRANTAIVVEPAAASETTSLDDVKPQKEKIVAVEALPEADEPPVVEAKAEARQDDAATPAQAEPAGWSVQLSSAKDEKLVWDTWDKLKSRHKLLTKLKPIVVRADLGKKGVYYRLRLAGFDKQADAQSMCGKLKARGLSCFVSRIES